MRVVRSDSSLIWLHDGFYITEIVRPNVDTPEFSQNGDNGPILSNTCASRIIITKKDELEKDLAIFRVVLIMAVRPLGPSSIRFL